MKQQTLSAYGLFLALVLCLNACTDTTDDSGTTADEPQPVDTISGTTGEKTAFHNCTLKRKTLQENEWWIRDKQILVTIAADSTTYDKASGADSHRIIEVYKTTDCSKIFQQTLPVNMSPDFAYYIVKGAFDTLNQLVIIRGFDRCYAYDVAHNRLLNPLKPKFSPLKMEGDAGSGAISDTKVWGNYLFGYATDMGSFAFDLRNMDSPKAMMPMREYISEGSGDMRGIYLVEVSKGMYQAVVPVFNYESMETGGLRLKPLFDAPRAILPGKVNATQDNHYILLKEQKNPDSKPQPIGIDMERAQLFALPSNAASLTDHALLKVMKGE